ncbi:MAG: NUDIX hydrolase [Candidatus Diapherotrites archaeon]
MPLSDRYFAKNLDEKAHFEKEQQEEKLENKRFATVRAIVERKVKGKTQILLQTRWKYSDARHSGLLEIPGGHIKVGEHVFDALKREIWEETGLKVSKIWPSFELKAEGALDEKGQIFLPFCGQSFEGSSRIGFVFLCKASGSLIQRGIVDAKEPKWVSLDELKKLLKAKKIWAYDVAVLQYYLDQKKAKKIKF